MRIKRSGEQVQKERRTSSKGAENKFSASGEQVQKERRTGSKFAEMRIKEIPLPNRKNSLGQQKKFSWAREIFSLGKRIAPISLPFAKGHRRLVSSLAASLRIHTLSLKKKKKKSSRRDGREGKRERLPI